MSLTTLNELQKQAKALRQTSDALEGYAKEVSRLRARAIVDDPTLSRPFITNPSREARNYATTRTEAIETEFQKAIAPFEDHILAIMEINFRTEAKKAMMRAEAIEARIAASITIPEPLP